MRLFTTMLVAGVLALGIGNVRADPVQDMLQFYRQHALKEKDELSRCLVLLRSRLATDSRTRTDEAMRRSGCFDDFSGLVGVPRLTQGGDTIPDGPTVSLKLIETTLVMRIREFDADLPDNLKTALGEFTPAQLRNVQTVLVDLLSDPGGRIRVGRKVLEAFAPQQGVAYMEAVSRCDDVPNSQVTEATGVLGNKRYLVLVNGATASMAEWFTATLRYVWYPSSTTVIGVGSSRTFGKAIMQLADADNTVKVTCGSWTVPGHDIQGSGIPADVVLMHPRECGRDYRCALEEIAPLLTSTVVGKK